MTPFPEARALVLRHALPFGTQTVPLEQLGGRILHGELVCPFDVPRFDNSQVDGYALRSIDGTSARRLVGESAAGASQLPEVGPNEAVRIFTGAPMPSGANCVVMQEDARVEGGQFTTEESLEPGAFVRRKGEEITAGTRFAVEGQIATPPLVGLAASFGLTLVLAYRRPRVGIVGTGSELVRPGAPLGASDIYASNPEALRAALHAMGLGGRPEPITTRLVGDDPRLVAAVLAKELEDNDVLITVGGVSVGDHDLVRPALAELGVEEVLWRVAMKPGKPFYFGKLGSKLIFGLPGNPVSALVTFYTLVRPALRKILGLATPEEETTVNLGIPIERKDLRHEFVRATLRNGVATPVEHQGSHMQTGLAFADALIHLPDGVAQFPEGDPVTITPLRWSLG